MSSFTSPVELAEYLFRRLHQVGVRSGLWRFQETTTSPLSIISRKRVLSWVGNCNELNAGSSPILSSIYLLLLTSRTGYAAGRIRTSERRLRPHHHLRSGRALRAQRRSRCLLRIRPFSPYSRHPFHSFPILLTPTPPHTRRRRFQRLLQHESTYLLCHGPTSPTLPLKKSPLSSTTLSKNAISRVDLSTSLSLPTSSPSK